jgi:hypothetical protein
LSKYVLRDALLGRRHFGEFQKSLGLAKNILTTRARSRSWSRSGRPVKKLALYSQDAGCSARPIRP